MFNLRTFSKFPPWDPKNWDGYTLNNTFEFGLGSILFNFQQKSAYINKILIQNVHF